MAIPLLTPFTEIALLLFMAALIGLVGVLLHQPLIVSSFAVGLVAGPSGLDVKFIGSLGAVPLVKDLGQVDLTSVVISMILSALVIGAAGGQRGRSEGSVPTVFLPGWR